MACAWFANQAVASQCGNKKARWRSVGMILNAPDDPAAGEWGQPQLGDQPQPGCPVSRAEERSTDRRSSPTTDKDQPCCGDREGCICAAPRQPRREGFGPCGGAGAQSPARSPAPSGTGPQAACPDGGRAQGRARRRAAPPLDGKKAGANTIKRKRAILHHVFEYAVELEELPSNPLHRIKWKLPKTTETVDPRVVVNPRQARELLVALTTWASASMAGKGGDSG
jgi:hypothetical protein